MHYRCIYIVSFHILCTIPLAAQNTTGGITGIIKNDRGTPVADALTRLTHEPTGNTYTTHSASEGSFTMLNLSPGGPYTLQVFRTGYAILIKRSLFIQLGEAAYLNLTLAEKPSALTDLMVHSQKRNKNGSDTWIDADRMETIPSAGRNLHEYLRTAPQAKLLPATEGAVSVAGQNNRFNSLYIDGVLSNDVFGLSASGMNGGQAGISLLPTEAINQIHISPSPFDVSLGNFTGAAINAVTRSGTNKTEGAIYYFFSNASLVGKTPGVPREEAESARGFLKKNFGARMQGAIVKNKWFYFLNIDLLKDEVPQTFDLREYQGNTKRQAAIEIISNTIRSNYNYDPGSYLENPQTRSVARIIARFDYNSGTRNKFSFAYHHMDAGKFNTNGSNASNIHFSNDGYFLQAQTRSVSFEWRTALRQHTSNKLLIGYAGVDDIRLPLGGAFPRVRINDGDGAITLGTDISSTRNHLAQQNITLFDKYNLSMGKHQINAGVDLEYNRVNDLFIQNSFGNYVYSSATDFLTRTKPSFYLSGYSMNNDHVDAAYRGALFSAVKTALFLHDKIDIGRILTLNFGIRVDRYYFPARLPVNDTINQHVLPILAGYYDFGKVETGGNIYVPMSLSPRFGFVIHFPGKPLVLRGGMGVFTGRVPLAWPAGVYLNNGNSVAGYAAALPELNRIRFRIVSNGIFTAADFGLKPNRIPVNLVAPSLQMPQVVRSQLGFDIRPTTDWVISGDLLVTKNVSEIFYRNINLVPPTGRAAGPDNRKVYPLLNNAKISLLPDGSNPYDHIILLDNYQHTKGYTYNYSIGTDYRPSKELHISFNYAYNKSFAVHDGTSSVAMSQWRLMESVNGRNEIGISQSDFSGGHRVFAMISRSAKIPGRELTASFSMIYSGESGQPFSYVYDNAGMVRDDGTAGGYDLIYIPTETELKATVFLPYTTAAGSYTDVEQKAALEEYIASNKYLSGRRGQYAERNASRSPFSHTVDLKIKLSVPVRLPHKTCHLQFMIDIHNVANLVNRNWGIRYIRPFDSFPLIRFAGYVSETDLTPRFQFDPALLKRKDFEINSSLSPGYSSRWISQIGLKFIF